MAEDSAGKIWIAGGAGVSCCANASWELRDLPSGLPFGRVGGLSIAPDGKLWAVEEYGGAVAVIDPADQTFEPLTLPDSRITAVAFSQDTQWLGSSDGLIRQRSGVQLRLSADDGLPSNDVRSLLVSETTLWVGTSGGLVSYDLTGETFGEPVSEFDGQVTATLFRAPDGAIWAGSRVEGDDDEVLLGRYDGAEWEIWEKGDAPLPDSSGGVTAIGADAQRRVWVGVLSGGVSYLGGRHAAGMERGRRPAKRADLRDRAAGAGAPDGWPGQRLDQHAVSVEPGGLEAAAARRPIELCHDHAVHRRRRALAGHRGWAAAARRGRGGGAGEDVIVMRKT